MVLKISDLGLPSRPGQTLLIAAAHTVGVLCLLVGGVVSGVFGFGLGSYLHASHNLPSLEKVINYRPPVMSTFYADNGDVIGRFFTKERRITRLKSLPPHVFNAIVAAEDRRFFAHPGVDGYSVMRAAIKDVQAGQYVQGGSTITQQVVRLILLTKEKRLLRKMREALLALRLERRLTKEQILEIYLNQAYFGRGKYGIETAADSFFRKSARNLTIHEAALLAGLLSNPSVYAKPEDTSLWRATIIVTLFEFRGNPNPFPQRSLRTIQGATL